MKAFYAKFTVIKEPKICWDESDGKFNDDFIGETSLEIDSIDIPDHLIEKFRERFPSKGLILEKDIMDFLNTNG